MIWSLEISNFTHVQLTHWLSKDSDKYEFLVILKKNKNLSEDLDFFLYFTSIEAADFLQNLSLDSHAKALEVPPETAKKVICRSSLQFFTVNSQFMLVRS